MYRLSIYRGKGVETLWDRTSKKPPTKEQIEELLVEKLKVETRQYDRDLLRDAREILSKAKFPEPHKGVYYKVLGVPVGLVALEQW